MSGVNLDPDAVTAAIGTPPSRSWRACDPGLRRRLGDWAWQRGQWHLCRENLAIEEIEDAVAALVPLAEHAHAARAVLSIEHTRISIGLFSLRGTGDMFTLASALLQRIGAVGFELSIDAYGGSDEPDD